MKTEVSVVIPTYNEEENISRCINSLLVQSYRDFEIIIVDDGSTDKTREIVLGYSKENKKVKLVIGPHKGPGFSRNAGAKKAKGKILVFVDADMEFDQNYLKELIKPIKNKEAIGTEDGKQIAINTENIWSKCWGSYTTEYLNKEEGQIFRAILKKEFDRMGGFDPSLGYADDLTFYYKFNVMSKRVPSAICYHKNPETLDEVYKQSRWIGGSIRKKTLETRGVKYLVPLVMLCVTIFAVPVLAIRKCQRNRDFSTLLPWMLIFMTVRYFGTIEGIFRKIYFKKNVR